jgi:UDP-N-acetylglucosamine:LPS N-acetylglucosamine transferase
VDGSARSALLVCSPGGHLLQMLSLKPSWEHLDTSWVTLPSADSSYLLADLDVTLATGPTNRSVRALAKNLVLAWRLIRARRPDVILSTGAALAVPFFLVGRLHGCRLVYVESLTRTRALSFSGKMVYPLASEFFVQWPTTAGMRRRRARYVGNLL